MGRSLVPAKGKAEGEYAHGEKGTGKNAAVTDTSDE